MITLWKSLVLPHLDYCSQLWSPNAIHQIEQIESVQKNFFNKIKGLSAIDYWEQLRVLKMYSLQRRRERYRIHSRNEDNARETRKIFTKSRTWINFSERDFVENALRNFFIESKHNRRAQFFAHHTRLTSALLSASAIARVLLKSMIYKQNGSLAMYKSKSFLEHIKYGSHSHRILKRAIPV